jgi:hypothetical protein
MSIKHLLDESGLVRWPKKPSQKQAVIEHLSSKFESDKIYSEKEINLILEQNHSFDDIALLRRELIGRDFLSRENDGSRYWKN